jgi:hypothetical protein
MPTIKQLSRIFSQDDSLNRLQDQLASALNPILREIKGDLSGPLESPTVAGLRGRPIANTVPAVGQALVFNGTEWAAGAAGTTFTVFPPLDLSGTPLVLSIPQADATTDGYLSSADWLTFDGKVSSVTATSPLASSGGTTPDISLTGVVAAANGGTGLSTSGAIAGYVLTSDGLGGWTSSPVSGGSPTGPAGGVLGYPGSTYPNPSGLAGVPASVGAENTIKIAQAGVGGAAVIRWDPYNNSSLTGNNTGSIVGPRSNATGANAFFFPGGTMLVEGGQGTPFATGSDGGTARLLGGRATGPYRSGPAIVQGGASNDGAAGHAYVLGGSGGTNGNPAINAGNVYIESGAAGTFYGGNINIIAAGGRSLSGNTDVSGGSLSLFPLFLSNGGHVYVRGGDATTTGSGGDAYVRGGTSPSGTKGRVYVGATNTSDVYISSAAPAANVYVQNQQVDLVTALPTSGQFLGYNGTKWLPTTLPAVSPKFGNTLVVDSVNGNDLTGAVNGLPFATPQAAINYINTNSLVGVTVWIMPGTYALSAGITIPNTCSLRGLSTQTTRLTLSASNPGGTVTMLTMGENSRAEDLTLTLTSTNATTNLVGVNTPGNTSTTSKLRTCVVTVDNSTLAHTTTTNVYGIYDNGSGTLGPASFSFNFTRGVTINVFSNGGGTKRAVYVSTANDITFRDTNFYVAAPVNSSSAGSYVGVETTNATCSVQFRTCSISGPSTAGSYTGSDILQTTPGTGFISNGIQLGPGVDLVNKTAGGKPFTTYVTPTTIEYGLNANLVNSPHYLWPGVQTAADNTEVFYRFQQKSICQGMSIYLRTAPGVGKNITVTIRKSATSVPGSSTATSITATISGTNKTADHYTSSVDFALGEYLSVEIDGTAGNAAQDLVVQLDLF